MASRPWREGNRLEFLPRGGLFFPAMLGAIDAAERYILFEMYLFESGETADRFIDALCAAAGRGVRVCLLLDDFGAFSLQTADRQRLASCGAELRFFNPLRYGKWRSNLNRNHRKLLLVDGQTAFTGGAGITDDFNPGARPESWWRDGMVMIEGPVVADWQASFERLWGRSGGSTVFPAAEPHAFPDGIRGRLTLVTPPFRRELLRSFLNRVKEARRRVWIETAYFIPTWKVRRALKKAARRGVDVRIILPGEKTDHPSIRRIGQYYYQGLLKSGVRIFEYAPRFLHAKTFLCDDWVSIGSSNLDRWSFRWNAEANQEAEDAGFAGKVESVLAADMEECREISYGDWLDRSWRRRFMERILQMGMIWTEYLAELRRYRPPGNGQP